MSFALRNPIRFAAAAVLLGLACTAVQAGTAYRGQTYQFKQPNGEVLTLTLDGNDYYAEQRMPDGSLVIYDAAKKGICYATVSANGDELVSTGILASNAMQRDAVAAKPQKGLSTEARAKKAKKHFDELLKAPIGTPVTRSQNVGPPVAPMTGTVRGLTVIIDFPNLAGTITQGQVQSFVNDIPYNGFGNAQSVRGYYWTVSGGLLDYTNTVSTYYRAKHDKSYYADNTLSSSVRSQELITEALTWLRDVQHFDFSTLTRDSSNRIRGLNFFYAGETDSAWSMGLWPHMGTLSPQFCSGAICTDRYQISNMGANMSIGTFVHETGHLLMGWPDLYDYDGSSQGSVAGFCIMGYGGTGAQSKFRPTPPHGYFRYLAGWDSVTELNPAVNANAPRGRISHVSGSHNLYRWSNPSNLAEGFYMEAIYQADQNLYQPDQGLAIYHVDPAGNNSDEWHPYVQLEQADGRRDPENKVNYGDSTDLYDGVATRAFNYFAPNSLASKGTNSRWWSGYTSGLGIGNISAPGPTISWDMTMDNGAPLGDVYTGYLASGASAIQPSPWFQYAGGTIKATLVGPSSGADFDLKMEMWNGSTWNMVASSTSPTANESFTYTAASGYYRITIYSYSGAGNYTLTVNK